MEPNRAPRVLLDPTVPTSPGDAVGPGPRFSRHFASRGWKELVLLL
jgi:hypothetical protein